MPKTNDIELLKDDSIFLNKIWLIIISIIITIWLTSSYLLYNKGKDEVESFNKIIFDWTPWEKVEIMEKDNFNIKMEERIINEVIKTLSQYNEWKINLCKSKICYTLWSRLEYKHSITLDEEFKLFWNDIIPKYKVSSNQFKTAFYKEKWILNKSSINKNNLKILILESTNDYFIVFVEKLDNKKEILINKSSILKEYIKRIKHLRDISSLESKIWLDEVSEVETDLKNSIKFSFVYTIPKEILSEEKISLFIDSSLEVKNKELKGVELIKDKTTNFDKFNKTLSYFFERSIIEQINQKNTILIEGLREKKKEERLKETKLQEKIDSLNNKNNNN